MGNKYLTFETPFGGKIFLRGVIDTSIIVLGEDTGVYKLLAQQGMPQIKYGGNYEELIELIETHNAQVIVNKPPTDLDKTFIMVMAMAGITASIPLLSKVYAALEKSKTSKVKSEKSKVEP